MINWVFHNSIKNHLLVSDELQHASILHFIYIQRYRSHGNPYHGLGMIEKFDGFGVQGKVIRMFIVEEVDGVGVQFQAECFQE